MKNVIYISIACFCLLLISIIAQANSIRVSNTKLTGQNKTDDYTLVQFDLSWDNSWRTSSAPNNWDAAWVFAKFRVGSADYLLPGASSSGTTITVSSTADLVVGMPVVVTSGAGAFAANTVISSITNSTKFVVSATPTTALAGATVKAYRIWQHARLNDSGHSSGAGTSATLDAGLLTPGGTFNTNTNPVLGMFIHRSADGTGYFSITGLQLRWNYGANGVADDAIVDVKVFAIEMVYVPEGSFYIGSGGTEGDAFYRYPTTTNAYQVTSESSIAVGASNDNLYYPANDGGGDQGGPIPAAFPKGYAGFYCQKYEITQQQYVDFLNTLTRVQQNRRTETSLAVGTTSVTNRYVMSNASTLQYRNGIRCDATIPASDPITFYCDLNGNNTGGEEADGQWIACNYLTWMDGCAYSDWAGLRPMTELEFEKACRGIATPVANEYAWGTTSRTAANNITYPGEASEITTTSGANAVYNNQTNVQGPMRVGVFAKISTTRVQSGASYYGIMELSSNLIERAVTMGNVAGRSYTGLQGNGNLNALGDGDVNYWPGINGNWDVNQANTTYKGITGISNNAGSGLRGGGWTTIQTAMRASDRIYAAYRFDRAKDYGFRCVRRVP